MSMLEGDIVYVLCIWTTLIQYPCPKYEGIGETYFMTIKFLLMGTMYTLCVKIRTTYNAKSTHTKYFIHFEFF
jgi:hypothetical protein